jgi:hypothetical protein
MEAGKSYYLSKNDILMPKNRKDSGERVTSGISATVISPICLCQFAIGACAAAR